MNEIVMWTREAWFGERILKKAAAAAFMITSAGAILLVGGSFGGMLADSAGIGWPAGSAAGACLVALLAGKRDFKRGFPRTRPVFCDEENRYHNNLFRDQKGDVRALWRRPAVFWIPFLIIAALSKACP